MKTEYQDGSMKNTIRYSFVAPGAIGRGRGRGRGLKSLASKGKISTKSLFSQSSDLVKQYIKEVGINAVGKEQEQELTNFTMSSSQQNGATDKNSLVLEKEYMQVKAPVPSSANQGAINKGQGKAHKKFNMTSSPVNSSFHSCTTQVKQCTKEVETTAIGKGGEQTPASLSSYSGDSEKKYEIESRIAING